MERCRKQPFGAEGNRASELPTENSECYFLERPTKTLLGKDDELPKKFLQPELILEFLLDFYFERLVKVQVEFLKALWRLCNEEKKLGANTYYYKRKENLALMNYATFD